MSNKSEIAPLRVRHTRLAWKIPVTPGAIERAREETRTAIGTAYAESPPAASPAKALIGAWLLTLGLFVSIGAFALPAAAFA